MIKIIEKKTSDLIPYSNNARINDAAVDVVAKSIKEFGMKNPIIIDKDNVIIAGHTRLKACEKLGIEKVPCIKADDLTEDQVKAFRIADNSTAQIATWDLDKLQAEIEGIELDMQGYGLDDQLEEIEKIAEEARNTDEDDYELDIPEEPKAQLGDIYKLGNHRLMCGSSTDAKDMDKLMDGAVMDLCVTDPPCNVNYGDLQDMQEKVDKSRNGGRKILNDNMDDLSFHKFLLDFYTQMLRVLKEGGSYYIWHADTEGLNFRGALKEAGGSVKQNLIWVKNTLVLGRQDYQWKHEPCLYGWKDGAGHYYVDDRSQTTIFEDKLPEFSKMKKEELVKLLEEVYGDKISTTVIHENKPAKNDLHPTMKPIKLIGRLVKNSSKVHENVFDGFGGSGSTLIACEQLQRNAYLMELDPKYVDVIIDRWEQLTGQKAVKIN